MYDEVRAISEVISLLQARLWFAPYGLSCSAVQVSGRARSSFANPQTGVVGNVPKLLKNRGENAHTTDWG